MRLEPAPCPDVPWAIEVRTVDGTAVGKRAASPEDPGDDYEHWGDPLAGLTGSWRSRFGTGRSLRIPVVIIENSPLEGGDSPLEGVETFEFQVIWHRTSGLLPLASNRAVSPSTATVTIGEDLPRLAVDNPHAVEGDDLTFTVRLVDPANPARLAPFDQQVLVNWATHGGTAFADRPSSQFLGDYISADGHEIFEPGDTEKTIVVKTIDDGISGGEPETVLLHFNHPTPADVELPVGPGVGTIFGKVTCVEPNNENHPIPQISLASTDPAEATEGSRLELRGINVRLDLPLCADRANVLQWRTVDGSAIARQDYLESSGAVSAFANVDLLELGAIPIIDDEFDEEDEEDVYVVVGWHDDMPQRYRDDASAVTHRAGIIHDNDPLPLLILTNAEGAEDHGVFFSVRLNRPSGRTVSVNYETVFHQGSENGASSSEDFTLDYSYTKDTLTFLPDETAASVTVVTLYDGEVEGNETFVLQFSNLINAEFAANDRAVGTIVDND